MEPISAAQHAVELWGPVGGLVAVIMVFQFMAIKWLAARDDKRNEKTDAMLERVTTVVANNTIAVQEITRSHDELRDVVLNGPRHKMNGVRPRA
jgi:intracellular sulfur oxidation DsrE/DsrF family protein